MTNPESLSRNQKSMRYKERDSVTSGFHEQLKQLILGSALGLVLLEDVFRNFQGTRRPLWFTGAAELALPKIQLLLRLKAQGLHEGPFAPRSLKAKLPATKRRMELFNT